MSLRSFECNVLECDKCHDEYRNGDGMVIHFDSRDDLDLWDNDPPSKSWYFGNDYDWCARCRRRIVHDHIWETTDDSCEICGQGKGEFEEEQAADRAESVEAAG